MNRQQAEQIIKQLIDQALKAGLFVRVEDVNTVQQAYELMKAPPATASANGKQAPGKLLEK